MNPSSQKTFKTIELVAPERAVEVEPIDHRRQRLGLRTIVCFAPVAAMTHQLCPLQYGQVLGDGGLGDAGVAG